MAELPDPRKTDQDRALEPVKRVNQWHLSILPAQGQVRTRAGQQGNWLDLGSNESQELGRFQQRVDAIHKDVHPSGKVGETHQDPRALLTQPTCEAMRCI